MPDALLRVRLRAPDGRALSTKTLDAGVMTYGVSKTFDLNIDVPANLEAGAYLEIEITAGGVGKLASTYRLTYNG